MLQPRHHNILAFFYQPLAIFQKSIILLPFLNSSNILICFSGCVTSPTEKICRSIVGKISFFHFSNVCINLSRCCTHQTTSTKQNATSSLSKFLRYCCNASVFITSESIFRKTVDTGIPRQKN